jgi:hypothetical protein
VLRTYEEPFQRFNGRNPKLLKQLRSGPYASNTSMNRGVNESRIVITGTKFHFESHPFVDRSRYDDKLKSPSDIQIKNPRSILSQGIPVAILSVPFALSADQFLTTEVGRIN